MILLFACAARVAEHAPPATNFGKAPACPRRIIDPVSPGDCPAALVGLAQSWGHPLSGGPANWYSPDVPTALEQRLPVTVSRTVIANLPVNSQFIDEALRFPWFAKGGPGNTSSTPHRWPNCVVVPRIAKGWEPANVTASVGVQESDAGGTAGATLPLVPPPFEESTAICSGAAQNRPCPR